MIHPTAIVEDGATIGADVEIGPYSHVGRHAVIGDGTVIGHGAIVDGHTTIGKNCQIFPYALVGMKTQDLKWKDDNVSYVEIGDRTVIREFATVHLGTADGEKTIIGSDCLFMAYCHAAHGCVLGNHVICSNEVQFAGEARVDDWAIVGGKTGTHQFCHIGRHAMVGGMVKVRKDVPPYMLCDQVGGDMKIIGVNSIGLQRRGFAENVIKTLKDAHRIIYRDGLNRTQALEKIERELEMTDEVRELVAFYRASERGVA